jgi:hypothetical protein
MIRNLIVPSFDFIRRMMPRWTTQGVAEEMDRAVVKAVQRIARAEGNWVEEKEKFLWIFQGNGLPGFRRLGVTGEAAEIASFVAAARNRPNLEMPGIVMQAIVDYNKCVNTKALKDRSTSELLQTTAGWGKCRSDWPKRFGRVRDMSCVEFYRRRM